MPQDRVNKLTLKPGNFIVTEELKNMVNFEESNGSILGSPKGSLTAVPDDDLDRVHVSTQRKIPPNRVYLPKRVAKISMNGIHKYLVDSAPTLVNHLERMATPERDGSSTA
jgi:hypothetical protein